MLENTPVVKPPVSKNKQNSSAEQESPRAEFGRTLLGSKSRLRWLLVLYVIAFYLFSNFILDHVSGQLNQVILIFAYLVVSSFIFVPILYRYLPSDPALKCPGCGTLLELMPTQEVSFGSFCPECGSRGLEPGSISAGGEGRHCDACGMTLTLDSRGVPNFGMRACTRCGLTLEKMPSLPNVGQVEASAMRSTVTEQNGELEIVVPLRKHIFQFIFCGVFLVVWGLAIPALDWRILHERPLSPTGLLAGAGFSLLWVWIEPIAVLEAARGLFGKDRVRVDGQFLEIRYEAFGPWFRRRYRYPVDRINSVQSGEYFFRKRGWVEVRIGGSTRSRMSSVRPFRFAEGVDAQEAGVLAARVRHAIARAPR